MTLVALVTVTGIIIFHVIFGLPSVLTTTYGFMSTTKALLVAAMLAFMCQ